MEKCWKYESKDHNVHKQSTHLTEMSMEWMLNIWNQIAIHVFFFFYIWKFHFFTLNLFHQENESKDNTMMMMCLNGIDISSTRTRKQFIRKKTKIEKNKKRKLNIKSQKNKNKNKVSRLFNLTIKWQFCFCLHDKRLTTKKSVCFFSFSNSQPNWHNLTEMNDNKYNGRTMAKEKQQRRRRRQNVEDRWIIQSSKTAKIYRIVTFFFSNSLFFFLWMFSWIKNWFSIRMKGKIKRLTQIWKQTK